MQNQNLLIANTVSFLIKSIIFLLLIFLYIKFAGPIPFSVNSTTTSKSDAFSVTGEGKADIKPDFGTLRVGVTANAQTVEAAQSQMNTSINKVTDALKNAGIASDDIQTENYNVNPNYDYTSGTQKITGYNANTNLVIKIRDINKANQIIDLTTQNGANQLGGLTFENLDKSKAEDEARIKAVEDAKKKASRAAQAAGFSLGKLVNYQESFGGQPPIIYAADRALPQSGGGDTQEEPGTNEIVVNVTLSYEVR
ncbi:MAG: hypothetical protein US28_C0025G0027 [Candidatus Daviesbacteria bacterium GW2011_GWA1_36_8]|uniref:26 kDa periplasmic immunogenic protein n=1 Tax=Candidatus Daviesbacteria bacterium GW2011_GWA1_36_8 TaxID=1618417 RepID=A0A0G0HSI4_9BACT|nr:MAG: hypothetical protein US28_C0025G0027 [Candidatus Daviesbacteria bacterium GW2011_GWA1_36_8]